MASQEMSDPRTRMRADARRNYVRLVDAAREIFTAHGQDATLEQVAKAAGVGIGTLYRHFPTRLALVETVYREDVEALGKAAEESRSLPPWDALVGWLELLVEYARTKHALFQELAEVYEKDSTFMSSCRDTLRASSALVLARAQAAGVARDDIEPLDMMRLAHGVAMTPGGDPAQVKRMLRVVVDGLRAEP